MHRGNTDLHHRHGCGIHHQTGRASIRQKTDARLEASVAIESINSGFKDYLRTVSKGQACEKSTS